MRKDLILMAVMLGVSGPALAQSADPLRTGTERRVSAGIAIPFGPRGIAAKPQLELRGATIRHGDPMLLDFARDGRLPRRERTTRIGLTLEQSPKFTVDGREMADPAGQHNISTLGFVAIGVGLAAVVGGVLLLDEIRASSRSNADGG